MANIKSSKKRALLAAKRNIVNTQQRARMRNQVKACKTAIENQNQQKKIILNETISTIAKMAQKGIIKYKTYYRKICKLR